VSGILFVHWPAVNAHSQLNMETTLQRLADFQRALRGRFWIGAEHGAADDFIQPAEYLALLIDAQLGITHDVDEENMRDLESELRFFVACHSLLLVRPDLLFAGEELLESRIVPNWVPDRIDLQPDN
jgi:hypothetical protein